MQETPAIFSMKEGKLVHAQTNRKAPVLLFPELIRGAAAHPGSFLVRVALERVLISVVGQKPLRDWVEIMTMLLRR
jgi:hypothetical protein